MCWREGDKARNLPDEVRPTRPMPDIYFAIRIQNGEPEPKGFLRHQTFRNFTHRALIACKGLRYSPSADPETDMYNYKHHQICFPFAIVETKHQGVPKPKIEACYCQAANSSSTALAMLCNLSKPIRGAQHWWGKHNEVPPVVSFTFIGYHVRLWLSYVSNYNCANEKTVMHQYVSYSCTLRIRVLRA